MNEILKKKLADFFEQDYQGPNAFVENVILNIFSGEDTFESKSEDYIDENDRESASNAGIISIVKIGDIDTDEGIEVFDITLKDNKQMQYNRVGIQDYIRRNLFGSSAFMIFHNEHPEGKEWRFSFFNRQGETSAKRYTYLFSRYHRARTASERFANLADIEKTNKALTDAFSVKDLSDEFFDEYREQYGYFCDFLFEHRNDPAYFGPEFATWEDKYLRDYVKKMLGRITFIYFLQRKGWMNGDMNYMRNAFMRSNKKNDYLDAFLEPLFFGVLNTKPEHREKLFKTEGWDLALLQEWANVPYLNGGLFERDKQDEPKSRFTIELFEGLFNFYARYNFTIDENDPDDAEVGVDPEMLGKIFESLLEDNRENGVFYTPKEIVDYMCQESLIAYLQTNVTDKSEFDALRSFVQTHDAEYVNGKGSTLAKQIDNKLKQVKICDPAIGSGAFPVGLLNLLVKCREAIGFCTNRVELKREIIQNNIYGVDIERGAVDIARLRFWLSLVVDEDRPQALPNLDYKIICGNSLLHQYELGAPFSHVLRDYNQRNRTDYNLNDYKGWVYEYTDISDHSQKTEFRQKIEDIKHAFKSELSEKEKGKISKVRGAIANLQMGDVFGGVTKEQEKQIKKLQKELQELEKKRDEILSNKLYENAFEWRFEFPALLNEEGDFEGFDLIIGNPPYGVSIKDQYRKAVVKLWGNVPDFEIYYYFIQLAEVLLKQNGVLSYIVPNTYLFNNFAKNYRIGILERWNIIEILDCTKFKIFESATVYNTINTWRKSMTKAVSLGYRKTADIYSFVDLISTPRLSMKTDDLLKMNQNWGLAFFLSSQVVSLVNKICFQPHKISDFYNCSQGYIPYRLSDLVITYGEDEGNRIKNQRLWHSPTKSSDYYIREIYGRDITKYNYSATGEYVKYGKHVACYVDPVFFSSPRLLVREITNPTIIASYIEETYINDPQLIPIISKEGKKEDLYYLWGILNSKIATFYHFNHSPKATKGAFPKILVTDIKDFPLPIVTDNIRDEIVTNVTKAKQFYTEGKDTEEIEKNIDILVYHLYNLAFNEVQIVDPETTITRDEYESKR
jgi:hypothetical protein